MPASHPTSTHRTHRKSESARKSGTAKRTPASTLTEHAPQTQAALVDPYAAGPDTLLRLQRGYGNQAVSRLIDSAPSPASGPGAGVIQRQARNAIVTVDTRLRTMGENNKKGKSLIHGTAGQALQTGTVIKVHDDRTFKSRLQTDRRQRGYRRNQPDTAWHQMVDDPTAYIRTGTFRILEDVDAGSDSDSDEVRPFQPEEMVYLSDNPDICEGMVTVWMQNRGRLQKYFNVQVSGTLAINSELHSPFHTEAGNVPHPVGATQQSDYINHLHGLHPSSGQPAPQAAYAPISQLLARIGQLADGGMMHVSMRKNPIESGGHAVGVARVGTRYYIFDPSVGMARLMNPERLQEAMGVLLNTDVNPREGRYEGDWAKYAMFYAVMIPNANFTNVDPQRMPEDD
jgi:hypothetical protein